MATHRSTTPESAILDPKYTYASVTEHIADIPLRRGFHPRWLLAFGAALALLTLGLTSIAWLLLRGVGVWGVNVPVAWGFAIINFVWWIGIGHAGTLISAILLLLRQPWRTSINRFAEAMTLFAVANAGLFPLLHLGRIWKFYYLFPYPNTMDMWPQWRSPLMWDVFAVMTYSLVSFLFWYLGLLPDLATMRDRTKRKWVAVLSGIFALGWRGSARHWQHYQSLYLLLAGLATPLVVSVHSIVSFDFAISIVPGWHTTVYPPFFVAGAIYCGFAMVLVLAIPLRRAFRLEGLITQRHLDNMAKVMLTAGLIVGYGYVMEIFTGWYSGELVERFLIKNRALGPYGWSFWAMIVCNIAIAQLLWFKRVRTTPWILFIIALAINVGMWLERFVIVVVSLHRDYLPSSWGDYTATFWDWTLYIGTIGLFVALMLLFIRFIPMISMFEVRELIHERGDAHDESPPKPSHLSRAEPDSGDVAQPVLEGVIPDDSLYGVVAEFENAEQLTTMASAARSKGYGCVDAYSPLPLPELPTKLGWPRSRMPWIVLAGAVIGGVGGYFLQWYSSVVDYPINIGGRPDHSWPSFIPLTFELAVLGGALFGVLGLFVLSGFPRPYHPVFNAPGFARASQDRFFFCIEKRDPQFDRTRVREFLESQGATAVHDVGK